MVVPNLFQNLTLFVPFQNPASFTEPQSFIANNSPFGPSGSNDIVTVNTGFSFVDGINEGTSGVQFAKNSAFTLNTNGVFHNGFTLSFWFENYSSQNGSTVYPNLYWDSNNTELYIPANSIHPNKKISFKLYPNSLNYSGWNHIAIVTTGQFNSVSGIKLYLNGKLQPICDFPSLPSGFYITPSLSCNSVGYSNQNVINFNVQQMLAYDDLLLFERQLSDVEVATLYNYRPVPVPVDGTQSYADFLLDGSDYFGKMLELFTRVYANKPYANVSGRDFGLDSDSAQIDIISAINQVANNGNCDVQLYLWKPSRAQSVVGFNNRKSVIELESKLSASVDFRTDSSGTFLYSNHQKISIYCIDGVKFALVSGLNMSNIYRDSFTHVNRWLTDPTSEYKNWHDTAIVLQGAVVDTIEQFFDEQFLSSATLKSNYIKLAVWELSALAGDVFQLGGYTYNNQGPLFNFPNNYQRSYQGINVNFLYTRAFQEGTLPKPQNGILDAVLDRIKAAKDYVYIEGFCLESVEIVNALYANLKLKPNLKVVVVVPYPPNIPKNPINTDAHQAYLTGLAYRLLNLAVCSSVTINGTDYDPSKLEVSSPWISTLAGTRVKATDGNLYYLNSIQAFTYKPGSDEDRVIFCSPFKVGSSSPLGAFYVHSKLSIYDDAFCIVGSANYNDRSMKADTEACVQLKDTATVTGIRTRLLAHFFGVPSTDTSNYVQYGNIRQLSYNMTNPYTSNLTLQRLSLTEYLNPQTPSMNYLSLIRANIGV